MESWATRAALDQVILAALHTTLALTATSAAALKRNR
jgi:hypothetical protein